MNDDVIPAAETPSLAATGAPRSGGFSVSRAITGGMPANHGLSLIVKQHSFHETSQYSGRRRRQYFLSTIEQ